MLVLYYFVKTRIVKFPYVYVTFALLFITHVDQNLLKFGYLIKELDGSSLRSRQRSAYDHMFHGLNINSVVIEASS